MPRMPPCADFMGIGGEDLTSAMSDGTTPGLCYNLAQNHWLGWQQPTELDGTTFGPGTTLNIPSMPDTMASSSAGYFINPTWLGLPGAELGGTCPAVLATAPLTRRPLQAACHVPLPSWPTGVSAIMLMIMAVPFSTSRECSMPSLRRVHQPGEIPAVARRLCQRCGHPSRLRQQLDRCARWARGTPRWGKEVGVGAAAVAMPRSPTPSRPRPAPCVCPAAPMPGCALATASPKPALRSVCGCRN